jgi:hypothetical protein
VVEKTVLEKAVGVVVGNVVGKRVFGDVVGDAVGEHVTSQQVLAQFARSNV